VRFDPRREIQLLSTAAQFLTRLPVRPKRYDPDWLPRGAKYFPLVGLLVGVIGAALLLIADRFWPAPLPQLLALGATILATGAFHEDGLADSADSLGGWTREKCLEIMKDSRLGTYGALALILCLAIQVASLVALPTAAAAAAFVAAHATGRLPPVLTMATLPYAGEIGASRIEHRRDRPDAGEAATAAVVALLPLFLLPPDRAVTGLAVGSLAAGLVVWRLCRTLGGYTGDVLGATAVVFQTGFLLGVAADPGRLAS
jgi:adenosylcobinamide-GDP ribazoletransferase